MKEKMTYKELEKVLKIKKSMIYRKILLLEKLSDDVKIILMNMKERKELELMSFRFLWDLSRKPQGEQVALLKKRLRG